MGLNLWRDDEKGLALYRLIPKIGGPGVLSVVQHHSDGLTVGTDNPEQLAIGIRDFLLAAREVARDKEMLYVMACELAATQELVPLDICVRSILHPLLTSVSFGSVFTVQLEFGWLILEMLQRGPGVDEQPRLEAEDPGGRIHDLLDELYEREVESSPARQAFEELLDQLNGGAQSKMGERIQHW